MVGVPRLRRPPGCTLFHQGDDWQGAYQLVLGACRYVRYDREGNRHLLGFLLPGEMAGLRLRDRYDFSLEAIGHVEAVSAQPSEGASRLALADEFDRLNERARHIAASQVRTRLASWLERLAPRLRCCDDKYCFDIPQVDIAAYLATTPETICRTMRQLREWNVIRQGAGNMLAITNRDALHRLALGGPCTLAA